MGTGFSAIRPFTESALGLHLAPYRKSSNPSTYFEDRGYTNPAMNNLTGSPHLAYKDNNSDQMNCTLGRKYPTATRTCSYIYRNIHPKFDFINCSPVLRMNGSWIVVSSWFIGFGSSIKQRSVMKGLIHFAKSQRTSFMIFVTKTFLLKIIVFFLYLW
jgi:hypothetical protein